MGLDIYVLKFPRSKEENSELQKLYKSSEIDSILKIEITDKYLSQFVNLVVEDIEENYLVGKIFENYLLNKADYTWLLETESYIIFSKNDLVLEENCHDKINETLKQSEIPQGEIIGNNFVIYLQACPTEQVRINVLYTKQIAYQRKGANRLFYLKKLWDADIIISNTRNLHYFWNKFFSGEKYVEKSLRNADDWGYQVEYKNNGKIARRNFKKNIIDAFIEGQTIVIFG